jgi:hypothetical protein
LKPPPLTRGVKLFRGDSFYCLPRVLNADSIEAGVAIEAPWNEEHPPKVALAKDAGWWVTTEYSSYRFSKMPEEVFYAVAEVLHTRGKVRMWCGWGLADLRADRAEFVNDFDIFGVKLYLFGDHSESFRRGDAINLGNTWWRVSGAMKGLKNTVLSMTLTSAKDPGETILDALIGQFSNEEAEKEPAGELDRLLLG